MRDVSKRFGASHALRGVSLTVQPGEVHALIGENGAGKSTLMKILSGAFPADSGLMELEGRPFVPLNPLHSRQCGIAMIYQELNLAPDLSVEENILLGRESSTLGWIDRRHRRAEALRALGELQHDSIPLTRPVHSLTIAEQQIVEIARALVDRPKVMIMDEPTSSLTRVDTENLFRVIGNLRKQGVSVVYISHFLEECQEICQRYTVLRDGETVDQGDMARVSLGELIHQMVGRRLEDIYPRRPRRKGAVLVNAQDLRGVSKPQGVSFQLHAGEILGIAGLVGTGRTETARVCFGLDPLASGWIEVSGEPSTKATPTRRLAQGMGLLSENRKEEGLMLNRSLADNLTLTRFGAFGKAGWISSRRQREAAQEWLQRLDIRCQGPGQECGSLSGGNQQKVALGRLLHHQARIFLLDEPTKGVDVGSKAQIYHLMCDLAEQGKAVLFISSYLPELLGVCDTIAVMSRGTLAACRPVEEWTEHGIIRAAMGQAGEETEVSE